MAIREINKNQIEECVQLIKTSFQTVADEFGFTQTNAPRFTAFATDANRLIWQMENEPRKMFAYFMDDKIVGYCSLLFQDHGECELNNLCVSPQYRHHRIGEQLFQYTVEQAKQNGCKIMNLGIVEENKRMRAWYEAHGAIHTGTKKYDFFPFTSGYMIVNLHSF